MLCLRSAAGSIGIVSAFRGELEAEHLRQDARQFVSRFRTLSSCSRKEDGESIPSKILKNAGMPNVVCSGVSPAMILITGLQKNFTLGHVT